VRKFVQVFKQKLVCVLFNKLLKKIDHAVNEAVLLETIFSVV